MNRTFPSWNRPRQPAVAGSTRAVDPSAQRADGYRLLVAVVVLALGELGIDHVVALRRLAARIPRAKIGSASVRETGCQVVLMSVVAVTIKKKKHKKRINQ